MALFNKMLVTMMALILIILGYIFFSTFEKTTFAAVLEKREVDYADIERIYIETRVETIGDSLVAEIEDPALISQIMEELLAIELRKQPTKSPRWLDNRLTVHTGFVSHTFSFDEDYFVYDNFDHRVIEGSFVHTVSNLRDEVEWRRWDEKMEEE